MDTQDIVATMIDKILAGENISAQEDFESLISDKMVTALEQKKQDIAQSLYAGNDVYDEIDEAKDPSFSKNDSLSKPITSTQAMANHSHNNDFYRIHKDIFGNKSSEIKVLSKGNPKKPEKPKNPVKEELTLEDYSLEEIEDFMMSEDFDSLDELSKATLGSYVKKASKDSATSHRIATNFENRKGKAAEDLTTKFRGMARKRAGNVDKAVDKLMAK